MTELLLAYGGLFLWSFLAATLLPLGSELALIALVQTEEQLLAPVLIATAGNYLGACTTYWIGRYAAQTFGKSDMAANDTKAARLMRRYGQPALLLSWVPVIGDAMVAVAGAMRVPFASFSFWVAIGKVARYAVVAWAASNI